MTITDGVHCTAGGVICISFAFSVLLGSLPESFDFTDGDEDDENNDFNDDADQRPNRSQTIYKHGNLVVPAITRRCKTRSHSYHAVNRAFLQATELNL